MKKCIFIFSTTLIASVAFASNWVETSHSGGGAKEYVDFDRIQRNGDYVVYWSKMYGTGAFLVNHWKTAGYPDVANQYKNFSFSLDKREVDCRNMRSRIINSIDYSKNGTPLESSQGGVWREILPDSMTEVTARKVCAY